jgi:hypothetical protein
MAKQRTPPPTTALRIQPSRQCKVKPVPRDNVLNTTQIENFVETEKTTATSRANKKTTALKRTFETHSVQEYDTIRKIAKVRKRETRLNQANITARIIDSLNDEGGIGKRRSPRKRTTAHKHLRQTLEEDTASRRKATTTKVIKGRAKSTQLAARQQMEKVDSETIHVEKRDERSDKLLLLLRAGDKDKLSVFTERVEGKPVWPLDSFPIPEGHKLVHIMRHAQAWHRYLLTYIISK